MNINILIILSIFLFSCSSKPAEEKENHIESNDNKLAPDFNIALKFINDYVDLCNNRASLSEERKWIESNPSLTNDFKIHYRNTLDSAFKVDPELGLGFDPIFDAQDYDEKGFVIMTTDSVNGYVNLTGKTWKEFTLALAVVHQENTWLVNGAGIINIPKEKRAKR